MNSIQPIEQNTCEIKESKKRKRKNEEKTDKIYLKNKPKNISSIKRFKASPSKEQLNFRPEIIPENCDENTFCFHFSKFIEPPKNSSSIVIRSAKKFFTENFHLLQKHPKLINLSLPESEGLTPFWLAIYHKQWNFVEKMFECNANIDVNLMPIEKKFQGMTPFWMAMYHKQWEIAEKIYEGNPDVHATPFEKKFEKHTPLWMALYSRQFPLAEKIMRHKPDVNTAPIDYDQKKQSPFLLAMKYNRWDLVAEMLKQKTDVNITFCDGRFIGRTPLWFAVKHKQWEIAVKMLSHKPDVEKILNNEIYEDYESIVDLCLKYRSNSDITSINKTYCESLLYYFILHVKKISTNSPFIGQFNELKKETLDIFENTATCFDTEVGDHSQSIFNNLPNEIKKTILIEILQTSSLQIGALTDSMLEELFNDYQTKRKAKMKSSIAPEIFGLNPPEPL